MKKFWLVLITFCMTAFLLTACGEESKPSEEPTEPTAPTFASEVDGHITYAKWFPENEVMSVVPAYIKEGVQINELTDVGDGHFQVDLNNVSLEDYWAYDSFLQECGWTEAVNNGENGLDEAVYSASLQKAEYTVTLTYIASLRKMYCANSTMGLSRYLFKDEEAIAKNPAGAQNKLYMRELYDFGNSYVFQLKSGHFFVNDGGNYEDGENLLKLLESLTPEGQIPVIDVMFITHAHGDHAGFLAGFFEADENIERVRINEVWYSEPSERFMNATNSESDKVRYIHMLTYSFLNEDGGFCELYRPQTGQRYYLNDIVAEVILTQEQLPLEDISGDFNDSSTWFRYTIEGQTLLFGGDGDWGGMMKIMQFYRSEFISCDIFHILHHGYNTWDVFSEFCKCRIAIDSAPTMKTDSNGGAANKKLQPLVEEWINWGKGTQVLTFPYQVGTAVTLPHIPEYIHAEVK